MLSAPVVYHSRKVNPSLLPFALADNVYVANASPSLSPNRYSAVGVHGSGVVDGRFVERPSDLRWITEEDHLNLADLGSSIRGSLCLYIWDRSNKELHVLPDPLGGGLVFRHDDNDGTAVSSDLHSLVVFLLSIGKRPQKSLAYLAEIMATGNGGLIPTSYENIGVIGQFEYFFFAGAGVTVGDYASKTSFFRNDLSADDALEALRTEVSDNLRGVASAGHLIKTAHLTGGFDSRLVLAGLKSLGVENDFVYFCSGRKELPDRQIAEKLSSEFDLTMTEYPGGDLNTSADVFEDNFIKSMRYSSGIVSGQLMGPVTSPIGGSVILSGGYGECLRSFYDKSVDREIECTTAELAHKLWGNVGFSQDPTESLLADSLRNRLVSRFGALLEMASGLGLRSDSQLDYMYLNVRNRYYVGEVSRQWSTDVARFDPLYTLSGPKVALGLSLADRSANILGFDLMNKLSPDLAHYPFDTPRFNDHYISLRGTPPMRGFRNGRPPRYDGRKSLVVGQSAGAAFPKATVVDIEKARLIKAPLRQVAGLEKVRHQCKEMLAGVPRSELEQSFNYVVLMRLMNAPLNNRMHIRTVYNLYGSLLWYYDS